MLTMEIEDTKGSDWRGKWNIREQRSTRGNHGLYISLVPFGCGMNTRTYMRAMGAGLYRQLEHHLVQGGSGSSLGLTREGVRG